MGLHRQHDVRRLSSVKGISRTSQAVVFLCAVGIILLSFGWYVSTHGSVFSPPQEWQVHHWDDADYRYLAEHFFGVRHDFQTYGEEFAGRWGEYLTAVPFRDIGVGTAYLALKFFSGSSVDILLPLLMKIALGACYLLFFAAMYKRYGPIVAVISLSVLCFVFPQWQLTNKLLPEPFLRLFFLLYFSMLLWSDRKGGTSLLIGTFLFSLMIVQFKAQWMFYGGLILLAFVWISLRRHELKKACMVIALIVLLPLSLSAVHWIGWGSLSSVSGTGLHALWRTGNANLTYACDHQLFRNAPPRVCEGDIRFGSWSDFMHAQYSGQNLRQLSEDLDAASNQYYLTVPTELLRHFGEGIVLAAPFPDVSPLFGGIMQAVFWIVAAVLIGGLVYAKTAFLAWAGLSLWIVPAIGNVLATYDGRYHRPMAGIPIVIAFLIAVQLYPPLSSRVRHMLHIMRAKRPAVAH